MILERVCKTCGSHFDGGPRAFYCVNCRAERQKETNANYRARKRAGNTRPLGSKDTCEKCRNEYTVESGAQRFCPECQPIHAAEYDRETSLPAYHEKKEVTNPSRNERRRIGDQLCVICNTQFNPGGTARLTCSEKCARDYKNKRWRERYYKPKNNPQNTPNLISQVELAKLLGVSRAAITGRKNRGTIPPFDEGKRWKYETICHLIKGEDHV